jgi:hypothetical protein
VVESEKEERKEINKGRGTPFLFLSLLSFNNIEASLSGDASSPAEEVPILMSMIDGTEKCQINHEGKKENCSKPFRSSYIDNR